MNVWFKDSLIRAVVDEPDKNDECDAVSLSALIGPPQWCECRSDPSADSHRQVVPPQTPQDNAAGAAPREQQEVMQPQMQTEVKQSNFYMSVMC